MEKRFNLIEYLDTLDRRVIYLFVAISLAVPILMDVTLPPAEMKSAEAMYDAIDNLPQAEGKIVLIASDWGPGTQAENKPQTKIVIEHLMRNRIPFALISITAQSSPFLESMPLEVVNQLEKEAKGDQTWVYGNDWVNLGFRPGGYLMIQGLAKADDLHEVLKTDVRGNPIEDIKVMKGVHTINDVSLLVELTGLVGAFNMWLQFFQAADYIPPFIHGCTSITIAEAHIYLASKQIIGLHEGIAGAAWHEKLLIDRYPNRGISDALRNNTGIAFAQIIIIVFIILGNVGQVYRRFLKTSN